MISGRCAPEATQAYAAAHADIPHELWRGTCDLTISSIGMGSYLGAHDDATDENYAATVVRALESGINVIDTAANYRFQRSERAIGRGLQQAIDGGKIARDQVLLCTKGGYIPFDGSPPGDPEAWINEHIVGKGVATLDEIIDDSHCMTPKYLKNQVDQSLKNLGVDTIDLYYVHNPEQQRKLGETAFYERLATAFGALEECVREGKIQWYGTATWDGYRVSKKAPNSLSLEKVLKAAEQVAGTDHHFGFVQLPFNFQLVEAMTAENQKIGDRDGTFLEAAYEYGVTVFTSVPLMQARLVGRIAPEMRARFPGLETDAQRLLQFVRSAPGITAPLVGMSKPAHVDENAKVLKAEPLGEAEFHAFFG